tara:strand:- start:355 stop:747 length:393 start_codon:yes stop_codon:yes gene_type:complete
LRNGCNYEKIAKIAVALSDLGYPITFTGRIFEDEVRGLHPNITFRPIHGKPDKITKEDYEMLKTLQPGSVEERLFMEIRVFVDSMPEQQDTLQHVFQDFQEAHSKSNPLLSLYNLLFAGYYPILLGTEGI